MKRTSKKQEYINVLQSNIDYLEEEINKLYESKHFLFSFLGKKYSAYGGMKLKQEMADELTRIAEDKKFKPWETI